MSRGLHRLLLIFVLLSGAAWAQGSFYQLPAPLPNAVVRVCPNPAPANPCPSPVAIFNDSALTQSLANPVTASVTGALGFWVASGQYTIQIGEPYNQVYVITLGGGAGSNLPLGVASGQQLVSNGVGQSPIYQSKPVLDMRDFGVTCNGSTDDTTAMQAVATAACNTGGQGLRLIGTNSCRVKLTSTVSFTKCSGVGLDGSNSQGQGTMASGGNMVFVWAGAAGGTVLSVNQTRDSDFRNFTIDGTNANVGLLIDEIGAVTNIVTNNHFEDIAIFNTGSGNSSWVGVDICPTAPGNCEAQNFDRLLINCAGTSPAPNATANGIGIKYEGAGGAQPFYTYLHWYESSTCSKAIDIEAANILDLDGGLPNANFTDLFVNGGRNLSYRHFRSENANSQIVIGTSGSSPAHDLTIEENSFSGLTNSTTTISFPFTGTGGIIRMLKNDWDANATVTAFGPSGAGSFVGTIDSEFNNYPNATLCPVVTTALWFNFNGDVTGCPNQQNYWPTFHFNNVNQSLAIGKGALASFTDTGATDGQIAIGKNALNSLVTVHDTTGGQIAIGYQALKSANNGVVNSEGNIGIGYNALSTITTGVFDTCVGYQCMQNVTGGENTAFGYQAIGSGNASGTNETAIGYKALFAVSSGVDDTAVGDSAASAMTTGGASIAIGPNALKAATTSNYNIAIGLQALQAITTENQSGTDCCGVGVGNTGGFNVAIGDGALRANTTGYANLAIGYNVGPLITTGHGNFCIGYNTCLVLDTGLDNTAVGHEASEQLTGNSGATKWSVSLGTDAYFGNITTPTPFTATAFTALGALAGQNVASGADANIFVGMGSGGNCTTCSGNIIIGTNVGATSATSTGELDIGNVLYGTGMFSSTTVVGEGPATTTTGPNAGGKIGIMVEAPANTLEVGGTGILSTTYATKTNCQLGGAAGTTSPAACGSAASGAIAIPASQTGYTVNTTAVTANSHIFVQQITDNSGISSATCNAGATTPIQSARVASTSFTFTLTSVASVTCIQYWIVD